MTVISLLPAIHVFALIKVNQSMSVTDNVQDAERVKEMGICLFCFEFFNYFSIDLQQIYFLYSK